MGENVNLLPTPHQQIHEEDLDRVHPELGIPLRILLKAIQDGAAGRASVSRHHFRSEAGHRERADRVASVVESVIPLGGRKLDGVGVMLPCQQRVLLTVRGDKHTGVSTAIAPKCTNRTAQAVLQTMDQLRTVHGTHEAQMANPPVEFWVLLVHYDADARQFTAEVSRPHLVDARRIVGFDRRLLLPSYRLQSVTTTRRQPAAGQKTSSEVKVRRKRKSS